MPQHIVQRGNYRLPCFVGERDRLDYLHLLRGASRATGALRLHAYVLIGNHVQLLARPRKTGVPSRMMQTLGRQYVGLFNVRHRRTGTLRKGVTRTAWPVRRVTY